jgi:eukaryotic-like serine/threonine-protein kinase
MTESGSKADILVVEDDPSNLRLLLDVLQDEGYRVRPSADGKQAIAAALASPPDLVLLDISMPDIDGYEVCRRLKADDSTRHVPVVFISGFDEVLNKVKAFEAGGVDYLTKPFEVGEVIARVENQFKIARLQKALEQKNVELERKNAELAEKNEELLQAYKRAGAIFFAMSDVVPGSVVDDKYRIEKRLGSGRYGVVYRATHLSLDRPVALKILRPRGGDITSEGLMRLRAEGIAACRVNHPNAVFVLDFDVTPAGIAYLAMELLEGRRLDEELQAKGPLPPDRVAQILVPVCDVLAEAHAAGLVHRDIQLDSVFLHESKDGEVVKVLNFGLAQVLSSSDAAGASLLSTSGARDDVFNVGAMLYEMLSGVAPFPRDDEGRLTTSGLGQPPPLGARNPAVPTAIESVVMRALARSPVARPTAKELAQEYVRTLLASVRR